MRRRRRRRAHARGASSWPRRARAVGPRLRARRDPPHPAARPLAAAAVPAIRATAPPAIPRADRARPAALLRRRGSRPAAPSPARPATCPSAHGPTAGRAAKAWRRSTATRRPCSTPRLHRWFGWDGRADSLWAQGLRAMLDPREMGASARHVAGVMRADPELECLCSARSGRAAPAPTTSRLVDAAKAVAAFVETLRPAGRRSTSSATRWPGATGRRRRAIRWPPSAGCGRSWVRAAAASATSVRTSPTASSTTSACRSWSAPGRVDGGRHEGIKRLRADRFNLLGPYNDDADRARRRSRRATSSRST